MLDASNQPLRLLVYSRKTDGLHYVFPSLLICTWQLSGIVLAPLADAPLQLQFPAQRVGLNLIRTVTDPTLNLPVNHYSPKVPEVVTPLIEQHVMQGVKHYHVRLGVLDQNAALVGEGSLLVLSVTTKKQIATLAAAMVNPVAGAATVAAAATAAPTPQEIRVQNANYLARTSLQLGIPAGAVHDVDSISLRLIVERFYAESRKPCWVIRPSSSRPATFVLAYVDCTGVQPGVAERQVEFVPNQDGQLQYIRVLVDEAHFAPCARTLFELIQRFFPYLQTAITPAAYRRDLPKQV